MSVQKVDYRTNRADFVIAAMHGQATTDDGDRDELLARRRKSLWLKDRRFAKLVASPSESSPGPKARSRG